MTLHSAIHLIELRSDVNWFSIFFAMRHDINYMLALCNCDFEILINEYILIPMYKEEQLQNTRPLYLHVPVCVEEQRI